MAHLLLVEDDPALSALVGDFLRSHGYTVTAEGRGDRAVPRIAELRPELVLLDLMLPGLDGLEVCRRAREGGFRGAILMLTARGDDLDEVLGLQVGADDYLTKPVRPRVLLARVQAVLRRLQGAETTLTRGRLVLDLAARDASLAGERLSLTTAEFELLALLAQRAGEVLSRDDLSIALRGIPWDGLDRTVDLRVSRLRKRLGDEAGELIKSVRGSGYLLVPAL
jgi:two-component system response regulator RstA